MRDAPLQRRHVMAAGAALVTGLSPQAGRAAVADVLDRPAQRLRNLQGAALVRVVRAGTRLVAVGERGVVLLSDDHGTSWRQAAVPVSVSLTGVHFVDAQHGWAIGHASVVLATRDGGQTWERQSDGRTLAGVPEARANPLLDLCFADPRHGLAVGAYGTVLHTRDGGSSWSTLSRMLPNPRQMHWYAVRRHEGAWWLAGEQGLVVRWDEPADGAGAGAAHALATPYRGSFFAMTALPGGDLLLGGLRGTVLQRRPDGEMQVLATPIRDSVVFAAMADDVRLVLADQGGQLWQRRAGETAFTRLQGAAEHRWVAATAAADGALVGVSQLGASRLDAIGSVRTDARTHR